MESRQASDVEQNRFPVSVIMARETAEVGRWRVPRWHVEGVLAGESIGGAQSEGGQLIHQDEERAHYLWSGFAISLYRDSSESYWLNLVGMHPSLFVVCREDPVDGSCAPVVVTANYDEAGAYMEADATVMSTPMPAEVHRWLEQYVMDNFQPVEGKSRKRKKWFGQQEEKLPPRGERQRG